MPQPNRFSIVKIATGLEILVIATVYLFGRRQGVAGALADTSTLCGSISGLLWISHGLSPSMAERIDDVLARVPVLLSRVAVTISMVVALSVGVLSSGISLVLLSVAAERGAGKLLPRAMLTLIVMAATVLPLKLLGGAIENHLKEPVPKGSELFALVAVVGVLAFVGAPPAGVTTFLLGFSIGWLAWTCSRWVCELTGWIVSSPLQFAAVVSHAAAGPSLTLGLVWLLGALSFVLWVMQVVWRFV